MSLTRTRSPYRRIRCSSSGANPLRPMRSRQTKRTSSQTRRGEVADVQWVGRATTQAVSLGNQISNAPNSGPYQIGSLACLTDSVAMLRAEYPCVSTRVDDGTRPTPTRTSSRANPAKNIAETGRKAASWSATRAGLELELGTTRNCHTPWTHSSHDNSHT